MASVLLDVAGHRRSPATMPGYHRGRPPRNKGSCRRRHDQYVARNIWRHLARADRRHRTLLRHGRDHLAGRSLRRIRCRQSGRLPTVGVVWKRSLGRSSVQS